MTNAWSQGYVTDIAYTHGYYQNLSPCFIRFCLLLQQLAGPPAENFTYCELGFGQGVSLNIHAAASAGAFSGTDFNPQQASYAAQLAAAAGSNLNVYDDSFADFGKRDLPQFDYIGLHGIWSWISRSNRQHIVDFVDKHLKRGGVLSISYNCLPGLAALEPLRKLFLLHGQYAGEGRLSSDRVKSAVEFTDRLFQARPQYAFSSPSIAPRFEEIKTSSVHYIAHEYFNADWECMYFSDVAEMLAEARLTHAGSAMPPENVRGLGMSQEAQDYLNTVHDPVLYQQMYDYFVNRVFRKDLFVRGALPLSGPEQNERIRQQQFVLVRHPSDVGMSMDVGMGSISFKPEIYKPVLDVLAEDGFTPKRLGEIQARLAEPFDLSTLLAVCVNLMGLGAVHPCQPGAAVERSRAASRAFNTYACRLARTREEIAFLAAPLTGSGVHVPRLEQIFLDAAYHGKEVVPHVLQVLRESGGSVMKDSKNAVNDTEAVAILEEQLAAYREKKEPVLAALGIV